MCSSWRWASRQDNREKVRFMGGITTLSVGRSLKGRWRGTRCCSTRRYLGTSTGLQGGVYKRSQTYRRSRCWTWTCKECWTSTHALPANSENNPATHLNCSNPSAYASCPPPINCYANVWPAVKPKANKSFKSEWHKTWNKSSACCRYRRKR